MITKTTASTGGLTSDQRSKFSILLIDDEQELLNIVSLALCDAGYNCRVANSAPTGLNILQNNCDVDIIISDINMPGIDGINFVEQVRENLSDRTWLQILFLTAHATTDVAIAALKLKAVDFLRKPIRKEALLEAVDSAALSVRRERQLLEFWTASQAQIVQLSQAAKQISDLIGAKGNSGASQFPSQGTSIEKAAVPSGKHNHHLTNARMLKLLSLRTLRMKHFGERLFSDPSLGILLDLMEGHLTKKQLSVSAICETAGATYSTAMRRLLDMEDIKLIERIDDPMDKRRQFAQLTPFGIQRVTEFLRELDARVGVSWEEQFRR